MTLRKLGVSLPIFAALVAAFAVFVHFRAAAREAALIADHPARGQFITVNGAQVHYLMAGSGPDLILIHGASGNALYLTGPLAADLTAQYRVIAFDRPGLGWSDPIKDDSLKGQALHLSAAAEILGVTNPIVVGQSYGGAVSLAWALNAPVKPRALVLISAPSLPWPGALDIWYRLTASRLGSALIVPIATALVPESYIDSSIKGVFAPASVPADYGDAIDVSLTLRRSTLRANAGQVNALRDQIVAMEVRYPELTLPIEMLHGAADTIVPLKIHSAPFALRQSNAHLTVINGAGHMPHYSHTDLVIAAIARAALRSSPQSP